MLGMPKKFFKASGGTGSNHPRLNKTAKEIYDAFVSGTTVMLRYQEGLIETLGSIEMGTVTDANNAEFTKYSFQSFNNEYYAYGDNYYPVSNIDVAEDEAGYVSQ